SMGAVSRQEQARWLARVDDMRTSVRSLIGEARSGGHDPVPEAVFDMLDELRAELLEGFQTSRRETRGEAIRAFHPNSRPVAVFAERCVRRLASSLEWHAAGIRVRLKGTSP